MTSQSLVEPAPPDAASPAPAGSEAAAPTSHELVIEATGGVHQYWRDLWAYRELIYYMAWRDVLVRYKQTIFGIAWSVLRPLLTMLAGTFVFRGVVHAEGLEGVPYAIMVYAGVLPWQFFSDALSQSSMSMVSNSSMISKIYFPRLLLPISKVIVSLLDFVISLSVMAVLMVWYQYTPSWHVVFLPVFILITCAVAMGLGQWFAALNVKFRDFMYIVPFVVQYGIYVTPVFFKSDYVFGSHLPEWVKVLYALNPMVGVVDGFRWCILGDAARIYMPGFYGSLGIVVVLLVSGNWYFRRTEKTFADVI